MRKLRTLFSKKTNHATGLACSQAGDKGLTLVESLVAISILVVAVFGPMYIVSQAIRTAYLTRDQMTAFYLAQESIEYVRNVRDTNSLISTDPLDWLEGIEENKQLQVNAPGDTTPSKYAMVYDRYDGYELVRCSGTCPKLNVDRTSRIYGGDTVVGTVIPSIYTREITFWSVAGDVDYEREIVVKVVVRWSQGTSNYEYRVQDYLKNWKINP